MSTQNIYSFGEKAESQDRKRPLSTITETNNESNSTSRPQETSKDTPKKDTEKGMLKTRIVLISFRNKLFCQEEGFLL